MAKFCPNCGKEVSHQTIGQIGESIIEEGEGIKIQILSPIVRDKKGQFKDVLDDLRNKGFVRVRVDDEIRDLEEDISLAKTYRHNIDVVVDRLKIRKDVDFKRRLVDSLETAAEFSEGLITVLYDDGEKEYEKKYFGKSTSVLAQTGHHIGIYGQALTYDFELGYKGIQSNFSYGGGLEYGYTHPISEYLAIEFVLGIGYLGGEYKVYVPMDECYVWQETRSRHYIGPTKAGVIISYRIGRKKGGR